MSTTQTTSSTDTQPKAGAVPARAPKQERPCSCAGGSGECDTCKKKAAEPILQRKAAGPARATTAPPSVNRVLDSPGRPLDAPARSFMEPRFGRDFGGVRVHTDPAAAESARAVDAHAYTVGQHIVFDSGKYDPHSGPGRNLLAHELAHTVQQRGTGPASPVLRLGDTPEYNHLENEAARVSQAVVNHSGAAPVPRSAGIASRPILSRAKNDSATAQNPKEKDATPALKSKGVAKYVLNDDTVVAKMSKPFPVPATKGDVVGIWEAKALSGKLEATYDLIADKNAQERVDPGTEKRRSLWLERVGWNADPNPGARWKAAGGDSASFDPPKAGKRTCDVDHIVELQIGGDNVKDNMQMLDRRPNRSSGGTIRGYISQTAKAIQKACKDDKLKVDDIRNVTIHYDTVAPGPADPDAPPLGKCYEVEKKTAVAAAPAAKETGGIEFPLMAGSTSATMFATTATQAIVKLEDSTDGRNKSAAMLIPGLSLTKWQRTNPKNPKDGGTVHAHLNPGNEGKGKPTLPAALFSEVKGEVTMHRSSEDGNLKLAAGPKNLKAIFKYLSPVTFTSLKLEDDGTLSGAGRVTPQKYLPPFDVVFNKDEFKAVKAIPPDKLQRLVPIPGVKILRSDLVLQLAPDFMPSGEVGFSLATGKRHLLDGQIKASADPQGLVLDGDVQVSLPGVDNAAGHIEYRGGQWSGKAEISATQLKSKLKYITGGSLVVVFNDHGMAADGKVQLKFPGVEEAEAQLLYESGSKQWMFKGKAIFKPPGLEQTEINIYYDGEHFEGKGKTGFTFHGIHGTVSIVYRDEKLSGEGALTIDKGKAKGSIHVKMRDVNGHPVYSGDGTISYQIRDDLIATGGIEINEKQEVRLKGELAFPKPIRLFGPLKGDYEIFDVGVSIPIPGASIGPIGLKARIDGSLSAGYQIGPGELRNTKISAAFNPLEDKPDVDVEMTSTLYVGGSAYISGRIQGGIALDVGIASVEGGLAITAKASLDGHASSEVHLHYQKGKFEADANFELLAALALTLALDAFVEAEAGVWRFKIKTRKDWNLATFHYDTGLQFGMKLKKPVHYSSDEGVKLPSADDIEWIKPDIHPVDMLEKIFAGGGTEKEE